MPIVPQSASVRNGVEWMDADSYIFDIDGTLLNTRDLVHWNALHQAMLEVYDRDTTIEEISYHGKTDVSILRAALERVGIASTLFEQRLPMALNVVRREVANHVRSIVPEVCTCVPELLSYLCSAGKLLGLASGNLAIVGWHKVEAAGLSEFFAFGCFSDNCETRIGIFSKARVRARSILGEGASTCFVGDTPADIHAAHELNANMVAVGSGTFSTDVLAAENPDACFASCKEFLNCWC
jgi:phosphoglycolate phosphatase-like HAD superfamily hydrolase